MVILISGASHTGKTVLAQQLMEQYHYPYLSIDHLKMGLIRSGNTALTPCDDEDLTSYLWPILREMIKTVIENDQNLIIEGCYIPFSWAESFEEPYLEKITAFWLIMSKAYIENRFHDIRNYENAIEHRLDVSVLTKEELTEDNLHCLSQCKRHGCNYVLIEHTYDVLEQITRQL